MKRKHVPLLLLTLLSAACVSQKQSQELTNPVPQQGLVVCMLFPESDTKTLRMEVRNQTEHAIGIDTYYFGFELRGETQDGKHLTFDFSWDKVPVPAEGDWHVLNRGSRMSWLVQLPPGFDDLSQFKSLQYQSSMSRLTPPKWVQSYEEVEIVTSLSAVISQ